MWLHSLKVAQLRRSAACLHTNQSRSYLNHLVIFRTINSAIFKVIWRRNLFFPFSHDACASFLILYFCFYFLDAFTYSRKAPSTFVMSVSLSVGPSFRLSACISALLLDGFPLNLILGVLWKCVMKIHIWLKSSKNIGNFT